MVSLNVGGVERGVIEAATTAVTAGAFFFAADAAVEYGRVPYLDEVQKSAPTDPNLSNFEKSAYAIGGLLFVLGLVDIATKHKLFGVGRWAVPGGLGIIGGTSLYEGWGAEALGIRTTM
jgi:hypothetical protein